MDESICKSNCVTDCNNKELWLVKILIFDSFSSFWEFPFPIFSGIAGILSRDGSLQFPEIPTLFT